MLELRKVRAGYGSHAVVHDIDLTVRPGEIVALVGANGAGKSTLLKTISGLLPPLAGELALDGRSIAQRSTRERVAAGLAHVPEGRQVFSGLSVGENLRLGAYSQRARLDEAAMQQRLQRVCEPFPILMERLHQPAGTLSGGQQQMLAIARGLMAEPRYLLLDEPSLGLSPILVVEIFRKITALREQGLGILLSEQNARMSLAIADHACVIENGRVTLEGSGRELAARPDVAERYLGVGKGVASLDAQRHAELVSGLRTIFHGRT
jgi:branched-chain amino acid transport system ATP-binding protein